MNRVTELLEKKVEISLHWPSVVFGIFIGVLLTPVLLIGGAFILSRILTTTP